MSRSDEFVFINSRPSGVDTQQSVNQTCIKLQGSEPVPDPVFRRVNNNRGGERGLDDLSFIFKNQFRRAVYQSISCCSAGEPHGFPFIAHLSCLWGVLPQMKSFSPSPSLFGWGEENEDIGIPFPALSATTGRATHTPARTSAPRGEAKQHPGARHTADPPGEGPFAKSPFLEERVRAPCLHPC